MPLKVSCTPFERDLPAVQSEIAVRMMIGVVDEQQVRQRSALLESGDGAGEMSVIVVAEDVRVDDRERRGAEQRQRLRNAAGGFERLGLRRIDDIDAVAAAVPERSFDQRSQISMIDHDARKPGGGELLEVPHDQRPASRLKQ
jgi:hypothetical protein